jgi:aprataxin
VLLTFGAKFFLVILQDVISNGKRGSKAQCLKVAGTALSAGRSVFIDRCNIDVTQRQEFLVLAKERGVQAHALVINLPVSVCIQRASQRTDHEGGLEGSGVGGVVTRVSRSRIPPTLEEGFARITYCRTDTELEKTIALYSQLDIRSHLPLGVFGASVQEGKGTLASLLQNGRKEVKPKSTTSDQQAMGDDGSRSLAFPSISTADFQFDHEMAADIIMETVVQFHRNPSHAGLRFVFVDLSGNSDMLRRVSKKAAEAGMSALQFLIHAGDITKLRTSGGPQCHFIANATNW